MPARNLWRDALVIVGLAWFVVGWFVIRYHVVPFGDAYDYWSVNPAAPYTHALGDLVNFAYSPPLAIMFSWLGQLPWPAFIVPWTALNLCLALWLARPAPWVLLALAMPLSEGILLGQIELIMAACIVLGLTRPTAWALPNLAKPTVGVGVAWFAVRRDWRSLVLSTAPALVIVVASYLIRPDYWPAWLAFLGRSAAQDTQYLPLRLGLAAALVVWGAITGRRWTVLGAAVLAIPVIYIHSLGMLVGLPRLRGAVWGS